MRRYNVDILLVDGPNEQDNEWFYTALEQAFEHSPVRGPAEEIAACILHPDDNLVCYDLMVDLRPFAEAQPKNLCLLLQHRQTVVAHVVQDSLANFERHLCECHAGPRSPTAIAVSCREPLWRDDLLKQIKTLLYSRSIREQMDQLFGPER